MSKTVTVRRYGFKSRNQFPLFMIWDEDFENGEFVYACVIFSTMWLRSWSWWKYKLGLR
jgi:hypothetical protein